MHFFTGDSLLLVGNSLDLERSFKETMQNFCLTSGDLINNRNIEVYGWNTDHSTILCIAHLLGFTGYDTWYKIRYMGLPLTLSQNKPSLWLEVISKIKSKIASWGGQWLTKARKLILIKLVLFSLPIF